MPVKRPGNKLDYVDILGRQTRTVNCIKSDTEPGTLNFNKNVDLKNRDIKLWSTTGVNSNQMVKPKRGGGNKVNPKNLGW